MDCVEKNNFHDFPTQLRKLFDFAGIVTAPKLLILIEKKKCFSTVGRTQGKSRSFIVNYGSKLRER